MRKYRLYPISQYHCIYQNSPHSTLHIWSYLGFLTDVDIIIIDNSFSQISKDDWNPRLNSRWETISTIDKNPVDKLFVIKTERNCRTKAEIEKQFLTVGLTSLACPVLKYFHPCFFLPTYDEDLTLTLSSRTK